MLGFFRRFQKFFFIIVTFVIVVSFLFFGTTGSFFEKEEVVDHKVGELVDGSPLMERQLHGLMQMLEHGLEEGTRSPNLLSDSLVHKQFILSGLGKILAEHAFADLEEELEQRWDRAKNYVPYQHPYAPHISAKHVWTQFSPNIVGAIERVKAHTGSFDREQVKVLFECYAAQAAFPPPLLHQMLFYRQQQSEGVRPDPGLQGANVSLFGFQTVEDWFGMKFVEEMARFILNASCIAQSEGYAVSADEARLSLFSNVANGMKLLNQGKMPEIEEVQGVYAMQIRQTGLNEEEAIALWQRVLAFDRMFQEVGEGVFLDSLALDQFKSYATKGATVIQYSLPMSLQFSTFREMLKFQRYKEIVSDTALLALPQHFKDAQEVMDLHPELVYKQIEVDLASISKEEVAARVALKETWEWEADPKNFASLKEGFSQLAGKPSATLEERMQALDSLDPQTRFQVDQLARFALVDAHPEWVEEELLSQEMERVILKVRLGDQENPLSGAHFLALVESDDPRLNCYSAGGEQYFRVVTLDKQPGWNLLTFEEAADLLDEKLDQILQIAYEAEELEESFDEVKDLIGARVYADLVAAIGGEENDLDELATHRFDQYLEEMRTLAMENPDQFALELEQPYALEFSTETLPIEVDGLSEGEFAATQNAGFYQLIEAVQQLATEEEIAAAKEHLSNEAKHDLMRNLVGQF